VDLALPFPSEGGLSERGLDKQSETDSQRGGFGEGGALTHLFAERQVWGGGERAVLGTVLYGRGEGSVLEERQSDGEAVGEAGSGFDETETD